MGERQPRFRRSGCELAAPRVGKQLHHRETKTPGSDAPLPLPATCVAAFKLQSEQQESGSVMLGRSGTTLAW